MFGVGLLGDGLLEASKLGDGLLEVGKLLLVVSDLFLKVGDFDIVVCEVDLALVEFLLELVDSSVGCLQLIGNLHVLGDQVEVTGIFNILISPLHLLRGCFEFVIESLELISKGDNLLMEFGVLNLEPLNLEPLEMIGVG